MTKDEVKIFVSRLFCFFLQDQNTVGLRFQLLHCISMSIYIKSIDVVYVASKPHNANFTKAPISQNGQTHSNSSLAIGR